MAAPPPTRRSTPVPGEDLAVEAGSSAHKNADRLYRGATGQEADIFVSMAYDHVMVMTLAILAAKGETGGDAIKAQIRG